MMLFKNKVLRSIFGPKRKEETGEWRKLHYEELNDLYSAPNIIRVIESRRMEMDGECSTYGGEDIFIEDLVGNLRERDHSEDPDLDGRMLLKWVFKKWDVRAGTGSF